MEYKEIIKLLDAGYGREEIMQMQQDPEAGEPAAGEPEAGEPAEQEAAAADGAEELTAAISEMRKMFSDFTKEITAMNIMNSQQPADSANTVDDVIANIISPTFNKNKGE